MPRFPGDARGPQPLDCTTQRYLRESSEGLLDRRYRGRLVARQLDDSHSVIRTSFEFRDLLLQSFPETFSVPKRFAKHMMVVADIENGNADAVELRGDRRLGAAVWEVTTRSPGSSG